MRKYILAAVAALLTCQAFAADVAQDSRVLFTAQPVRTWTGLYVGVNAGYGWGQYDQSPNSNNQPDMRPSGGFVGGTVGYHHQLGKFVAGVEVDFQGAWMKSSRATTLVFPGLVVALNESVSIPWWGTARFKAGYDFGPVLAFITAGGAYSGLEFTGVLQSAVSRSTSRTDSTMAGWVAGAGLNYRFTEDWFATLEYLFMQLIVANNVQTMRFMGVRTTDAFSTHRNMHVVRLGVNRRL
jgi:outer membrane immunogenic protein